MSNPAPAPKEEGYYFVITLNGGSTELVEVKEFNDERAKCRLFGRRGQFDIIFSPGVMWLKAVPERVEWDREAREQVLLDAGWETNGQGGWYHGGIIGCLRLEGAEEKMRNTSGI